MLFLPSQAKQLLAACLAASIINASQALAYNWKDIPAKERQSTECPTDPGAAAEILYKSHIVDQGQNYEDPRFTKIHMRVKIYDESALDQFRKVRIAYSTNKKLGNLHARVVKPDGQSIELKKSDVFEQKLERKKDRTLRSTSFALPNLEVGDIAEYRYALFLDEGIYQRQLFLYFQEAWPIRKLDLKVRPFSIPGEVAGFKWISRRISKPLKKKPEGFYTLTMNDIAAYPDEPDQYPDRDGKAWFLFYNVDNMKSGEQYWNDFARDLHKQTTSMAKPDALIKKKAVELTNGIDEREDRLKAIYNFCLNEIENSVLGKKSAISSEQRKKLNNQTTASKTLERGYGRPQNINALFCALAKASGFDARLARVSDLSKATFSKSIESRGLAFPKSIIAIQNGDNWQFFDPGSLFLEYATLSWKHQGSATLIASKKNALFAKTMVDDASVNKSTFKATFALDSSGTLDGTVSHQLAGQYNYESKSRLNALSEEGAEEYIREQIEEDWPTAKIDDIEIQNTDHPSKPLSIRFSVTIPQYAEVIGKRIFFQPNAFQKNAKPRYPNATRKSSFAYDFKYSEQESIEIKLPDGYTLEAASAPFPYEVKGLASYKPIISVNKKTHTILYDRTLDFHGIRFKKEAYPLIKKFFDTVHKQDAHSLTLLASEG